MKKIILCAFFALYATFTFANDVTIVTTGTAESKESALNEALFNALAQQFGASMKNSTTVQHNGVSSEELIISPILWGNIEKVKSYKIISITKTKDKYGAPQMTAKIEVVFDMDKIDKHDENR